MERIKPKAILKIPIEMEFEFGRTTRIIEEVLNLKKGTMIKLDNSNKNVINIYINEQSFAQGKAMRKGEKMAVQVTNINKGGK